MKRGAFLLYILSCLTGVFFCWNLVVREVRAGIASDQAFEGVTWEKILEDDLDRKSTRLNSSHIQKSRMPSAA